MSILAFIKTEKNKQKTSQRLEWNHVIQHQNLVAALAEKVNKRKQMPKKILNVAIRHRQVLNICIKMSFQIPKPTFVKTYIERFFLYVDTSFKKNKHFLSFLINKIENHRNILSA